MPQDFNDTDAKTWRNPVSHVTGSGQITGLGPSAVKKSPTGARDFAIRALTNLNNIQKSGIGMQYCIENSPTKPGYPAVVDFIDNNLLDQLFRDSSNGKFMLNQGYKPKYDYAAKPY